MSPDQTSEAGLNRALDDLCVNAVPFARLSPAEKAGLVGRSLTSLAASVESWVADGCRAKQIGPDQAGEEWLSGPLPTVRMARLLGESLAAIDRDGKPPLGTGTFTGPGGRLAVNLFPASVFDRLLFPGFSGYALMADGVDVEDARRLQAARFGRANPPGRVALVLGAGNVSSIAPMDVLTKMFIEGSVCLLKMSPVNDWLAPHLERALEPLVGAGYLRIVSGGAEIGARLVHDARVEDVHITGSAATHDLIVWGPPGPDRTRRIAAGDPLVDKRITSELGNVGPVAIVPHRYSDAELVFQARNLATMITNNAGFNCNAAHVVITAASWPQHDRFFDLAGEALSDIPPRVAYYPGAGERYARLTASAGRVEYFGQPAAGTLAWAILRDVDVGDTGHPVFRTEPFCGLVSETTLAADDPIAFLEAATAFMNDTLWGTLNACIVMPAALERDRSVAAALDRAIVDLRYGMVGINHWPALGYGAATMPWGAHPGATPRDIQSGRGWVHNTFMIDGIDKCVIRGPAPVWPAPAWFSGNARAATLGRRLVRFESAPGWGRLPGVVAAAFGV